MRGKSREAFMAMNLFSTLRNMGTIANFVAMVGITLLGFGVCTKVRYVKFLGKSKVIYSVF